MKMSQREKNLLIIVSCVLVAVLYFQFIFVPKQDEIAQLENELFDVQTRYDQVMQNINSLQSRKEKIKKITASISENTSALYPTLIQEKFILALDELINETGVMATIGFSQISAQAVQPFTGGTYESPQSSLSSLANEYADLTTDETVMEESVKNDSLVTSNSTVEVMSIGLSFTGTYEVVKAFIDAIQSWEYNLVLSNLSLTPLNENEVSGSTTLEFYAVPKLSDQDQEYLEWTLENTYGKELPFSSGAASGAYSSTMEQLLASGVKVYDFMMLVRSSASDLPAVTIGKALDESRESYLFTDKNEVEPVTITFKQEGEKYYYRYETSEGGYPSNEELGIEFTPVNETIEMQIMSESRVEATDQVGVQLKVINETDLVVNIDIKDDDTVAPRLSVNSEGFTVNVKNK